MIQAGKLKERLIFRELQTTTTETGFQSKEYVKVYQCRGEKLKLSVVAEDINAMEEFLADTVIMKVRYNPVITENCRVEWQGRTYDIRLLDHQTDNSFLITLKRVNL